jgi:peptidyl-prolyl cis-trans isomerase A (cyclophilin A)
MGEFEITLREDLMPITTNNFLDLTNSNFYDDLIFHRVIADFMIQDGCPLGTGYGGPGYTIPDEWNPLVNFDDPYVLGMAKTSAPNSAGSQYFITVEPTSWLNENFAAFGHVTLNTDIVEEISEVPTDANDKPLVDVVIDSVRIMTAQFYAFIPEEDSTYATAGDPLVFGMFTNEPDVTYSWFVDELLQTDYDFMFNVSLTVNGWHEITGIGTKNGYDYVKKWWVEITGGTNANDLITTQATLFQNVPNPFNPTTTISFDITSQNSGKTDLIIYDLKGQLVKTLISELLDPGRYNLIWDGTSENGNQVSSGVYFYQLKTGNFTNTKKAVLLK